MKWNKENHWMWVCLSTAPVFITNNISFCGKKSLINLTKCYIFLKPIGWFYKALYIQWQKEQFKSTLNITDCIWNGTKKVTELGFVYLLQIWFITKWFGTVAVIILSVFSQSVVTFFWKPIGSFYKIIFIQIGY